MKSIILLAATRLVMTLLLIFSVFMLLRGHNTPGGGFIGGLIGTTGFIIYAISRGTLMARKALRIPPERIAMAGFAIALFAALIPAFLGDGFFVGQWIFIGGTETEKGLPISSVLVFDIGVYLVVMGSILTLCLALEEEVD
ncbi:MAG: Na(+)/H(+) antiporter subunit B [Candidatus Dadabacteria bacterium]|nr:Na(+)/H(+) antiporter subunit B [Candidatus Dadabacteria bacterium]